MSDFRYEVYRNPSTPQRDHEATVALHKHDPPLLNDCTFQTPIVEYLLLILRDDPTWSQAVREWYADITGWIHGDVLGWWQSQLDEHKLASMPREWWMYRALSLVVAWHGDKPVGAVSLTHVYWSDRGEYVARHRHRRETAFHEIRGLVVEREFRHRGVGSRLIEIIRDEAYKIGRVPTFAVTTSPSAVKIFEAKGATETSPGVQSDYALKGLACWCSPPAKPLCTSCPYHPRQIWWWNTRPAASDGS